MLYTGSGAALHGMTVIVPVDGMSAVDPVSELSAALVFAVSAKVTLTKIDMIKF